MKKKVKEKTTRTPIHKKERGKCTIPGAMPIESLPNFVLATGSDEADDIRSYVEWQAHEEKIKHLEKVLSENIYGQPMNVWDVHTNKGHWWVITNPTNLYSQKLFPSLDYTLSFHIGVTTRMAQQSMCQEEEQAHDRVNELWNRLARARTTLFSARKIEDYQSVGMKCRECLLILAQTLAAAKMLPSGESAPQRGNFIEWCNIIAGYFMPGSSNERLRSYLKVTSKSTWEAVNWLTHTQNADKFAASIAIDATENIVSSFIMAEARYNREHAKTKKRPKLRSSDKKIKTFNS